MINKKEYFKNLIFSNITFIAQMLMLIIITPIMIKTLGQEQYGIYVILFTIIGYFSLGNFGFPQTLLREIIEALHHKMYEKINSVISSVFTYYSLFISVAVVLVFMIFFLDSFNLMQYIVEDTKYRELFQSAIIIVVGIFALNMINEIFQYIIMADNKIYVVKLIKFFEIILQLALTYIVLLKSPTLQNVILVMLFTALFSLIAMYIYSKRYVIYTISYKFSNFQIFKEMLPSSFWYFVGAISVMLIFQSDVMVISSFIGIEHVAIYATMYKFNDAFRQVLSQICGSIFPTIAKLKSENRYEDLKKLYFKFLAVMVGLSFFTGAILYWIGFDIYSWWIGNEAFNNKELFVHFIVFTMLFVIDSPSSTFIGAMGIHRNTIIVAIVQGLLNLFLSIYLIKEYGLIGVILGSIIALLVTNFWFNNYYLLMKLNKKGSK